MLIKPVAISNVEWSVNLVGAGKHARVHKCDDSSVSARWPRFVGVHCCLLTDLTNTRYTGWRTNIMAHANVQHFVYSSSPVAAHPCLEYRSSRHVASHKL